MNKWQVISCRAP